MFELPIIPILILGLGLGLFSFGSTHTSTYVENEPNFSLKTSQFSDKYSCEKNPSNLELSCEVRDLTMETNFGNLKINLYRKESPATTYNFIKLAQNGFYNGLTFHRIVKQDDFSVIQGGDPKGNGTGGISVFGSEFEDEIYKDGENKTYDNVNYPYLYPQTVEQQKVQSNAPIITYKKGVIAMANRGPNTNTSQFFIILTDTVLPASYTIFGKVDEADMSVLDKIYQDIDPVSETAPTQIVYDGKPSKELKIVKISLPIQSQTQNQSISKVSSLESLLKPYNPTFGNQKAQVVVMEFADFQCPGCAYVNPVLNNIKEKYKDKVKFVYKMYPLSAIHKNADSAARSALAAYKQGKYLEYANKLYLSQETTELDYTTQEQIAKDLGLNLDQWKTDRESNEIKQMVLQDIEDGRKAQIPNFRDKSMINGVDSTPTFVFFKDGQALYKTNGMTTDDFSANLDELLK